MRSSKGNDYTDLLQMTTDLLYKDLTYKVREHSDTVSELVIFVFLTETPKPLDSAETIAKLSKKIFDELEK